MKKFSKPNNYTGYPIFLISLKRKTDRTQNVMKEFENVGIKNYTIFEGTDGWYSTKEELERNGIHQSFCEKKGLAGCASSHVRLWRKIVDEKIPWSIIFEDDVHLHPNFMELLDEYIKHIPERTDILYLGYCCPEFSQNINPFIIKGNCMCLHAYMISYQGAENLLNNILPIRQPVDIAMLHYYRNKGKSFYINPRVNINGIVPKSYSDNNSNKYEFFGIAYQNRRGLGTTVHSVDTLYGGKYELNIPKQQRKKADTSFLLS